MSKSNATEAFLSKCFKDGMTVTISPMFGEKYNIKNHTYKFTEEVLTEMLSTGRCKIRHRDDKRVMIEGIVGE
ncbi:hypothetical protein [Paenibacillus xylaniclasticus]|uniref:hypothetical protein n=1 Tax=Paenibacillus xylaniclasticus TaxID=588083 RepID=UPI000FDBBCD4|nr:MULTISPECIES: hypothetical protein [Paenibacillus]GFN32417.1 hypothetical protein PCURB6_26770 [Paenibacillus curdlanolyticus]